MPRQPRLPRAARPDRIAEEYRRALRPVLKPLLDVLADLTRDLEREWPQPQPQPVRTDAERDIGRLIARSADQFAKAIRAQSVTPVASKYAQATSEFQRAQLAKQAKAAVGVDIRKLTGLDRDIPRRLAAYSEENAQLITGLGARLADDVAKVVREGVAIGSRWETIAERLAERELVTESRAALIARDQVGKLFGEINKARQQNIGVSGYVWRTANDNRVREEHEALDGDRFEWSSPPSEGHPGEAVNCRCYADPDFADLLG